MGWFLTPNMRLFLLNCRGFHDELLFKIAIEIRQNRFIGSLIVFPHSRCKLVFSLKTYIFGGVGGVDSGDCKIKTHSKWKKFRSNILTVVCRKQIRKTQIDSYKTERDLDNHLFFFHFTEKETRRCREHDSHKNTPVTANQ